MREDREARIRKRAHTIWEEEGRPVGKEKEHWERAAAEVDAESASLDSAAQTDEPDVLAEADKPDILKRRPPSASASILAPRSTRRPKN